MGFILSPEMMKKTFSMGEDGDSFTHRSAQHIKLFPFTANNNATIVTSFSSVIGEWLRLCSNQNTVPESMESALDKLADALESFQGSEFELLMEINKDTLSKGETQVFVMSLYWAMMQQCKCELPFIIDTPFARIDTDHRANIVEQFFKRLPGQLFVLSTNEEISSKHMMSLHDQTSNVFLLEYGDDKRTKIIDNQYFEV